MENRAVSADEKKPDRANRIINRVISADIFGVTYDSNPPKGIGMKEIEYTPYEIMKFSSQPVTGTRILHNGKAATLPLM